MSLGERLFDLRKKKQLSQEEVAEKLNVTRQTVSKWETDASVPDLDRIVPLCELYEIKIEELLTGKKEETLPNIDKEAKKEREEIIRKRAKGIGFGILFFFLAVVWIMISIPVFFMNPIVASAIFLLLCGVGVYLIVYTCILYKEKRTKEEEKQHKLRKQINEIMSIIALIIYLMVSFLTMAWHITWIIWVIYALLSEVVKLVFLLRGDEDEE